MKPLLENDTICLRALEPEDIDFLYQWENNTSLWGVGNALAPYSKYVLMEYIAEAHRDIYDLKQLRLVIEEIESKKAIGMIDLFDFDPHHRRAGTGILLATDSQGNGWASHALSLMADYAFSFLGLHQLYAQIPESNTKSIALYTRCGFQMSGILHDWIVTKGGYENAIVMQKMNDL